MRRWTAIFLFVLSLTCSFTPCCLVDDCGTEQSSSQSDDHSEESKTGYCSPFASCASCGGFTKCYHPFVVQAPVLKTMPLSFFYAEEKLPAYHASFWQPPRC